MDPRPLAPDEQTAALIDDFLAAQAGAANARHLRDRPGAGSSAGSRAMTYTRSPPDAARSTATATGCQSSSVPTASPPAKRLSAVRSFYGYLVERGVIDASPAVGVKVPRTPREPRGHAITSQQVARLIAAAQEHSNTAEAIVRLLVTNGLRVSEVCAARVELLEREPGAGGLNLHVPGKGGRLASVALNE